MKAATAQTKESSLSTVSMGTTEEETHQPSHNPSGNRWKWRTRIIIGLAVVFLIVVPAVVIAAVFFGAKLSTDSVKNFETSFHDHNQVVIDETISVSTTEEKFQILGVMEVVLDFDKGLSTFLRSDERTACFLTTFNSSEGMDPKTLIEFLDKTDGALIAEREIYICLKVTNVSITNRNFLSPMTKEMCKKADIFWVIDEGCENKLARVRRTKSVTVSLFWGLVEVTKIVQSRNRESSSVFQTQLSPAEEETHSQQLRNVPTRP